MVNKTKRFSRAPTVPTPSVSDILSSAGSSEFIKSGEAVTPIVTPSEQKPPKETKKTAETKPTVLKSEKNAPKSIPAQNKAIKTAPWDTADPSLKVQHIIRLPAPLKLLIDHLGDTTPKKNQTKISVEGLTYIAMKMAKENGILLDKDWASWLKEK